MPKKIENKTENLEREYVIPIRKKNKAAPRYKKTNKAIKIIREFLVKHMKIRDRDLNKVKIDRYLNEAIWFRGIKRPPHKIKIKAVKDKDIIRAELVDIPEKLKFKKLREEKRERKALEVAETKKKVSEKTKEEQEPEKESEKRKEEKEKKAAVIEAGKEMEKQASKKAKHETGGKMKQPKHQQRKALEK